ncbi:MAG: caspase family protein, partial [Verrucomicrobiota bacterium]
MIAQTITRFLLCHLAALWLLTGLQAADRYALIIGNAAYEGAMALDNPVNDAEAMRDALQKLGFKVTMLTDADLPMMERGVYEFTEQLKPHSLALFFFAGHGIEASGENYLIPVQSQISEEYSLKRRSYSATDIMEELSHSPAKIKVMVLDCCRNNPLERSWVRSGSRSVRTGSLAAMEQ